MDAMTAPANGPSRLDRWLRAWSHLWDDVAALNSVGPLDLMTTAQCRRFGSLLLRRHPIELERLLAAPRIDPAAVERRNLVRLHGMELACLSCRAWRRCRRIYRNGSLARD
jgi:hypothetical protein